MTTVLITGASTGIGRALALGWAEKRATIVLSARGEAGLREVATSVDRAGGRAVVVPGDVTDAGYRASLVERAGPIDVLVNNAGRGFYAHATAIDLDALRALFELNVIAPLHLSQLALPRLTETKGAIVMMSSIAGVIAAPKYGAYAASKFALEAIAMAMRAELAASGVRVLVVRPGPVDTPFRTNALRGEGEVGYSKPDPNAQTANAVASKTIRAVDHGRAVLETSAFVRLASAAHRFLPPAVRFALRQRADHEPD